MRYNALSCYYLYDGPCRNRLRVQHDQNPNMQMKPRKSLSPNEFLHRLGTLGGRNCPSKLEAHRASILKAYLAGESLLRIQQGLAQFCDCETTYSNFHGWVRRQVKAGAFPAREKGSAPPAHQRKEKPSVESTQASQVSRSASDGDWNATVATEAALQKEGLSELLSDG